MVSQRHDREGSYPLAPYKIKVVEPLRLTTREERERALEGAGYNVILLRAEDVFIDLLTDSGTGAMSDRQWAGLMLGDESYAGSRNFYRLEEAVRRYYGYAHIIPTHQGRGAEHILSQMLISPGDYVPGNMYFTTTRYHQEAAGATFIDVIGDAAHDASAGGDFKGDVDLQKLEAAIERVGADKIPYVSIGATVNMAGGQPISLGNLRAVRELTAKHDIRVVLDAARAVENAYFIQQREPGQASRSLAAILHELCSLTDACTMSGKKDALVNIGGWLAVNDPDLYAEASNLVAVYEGLHTYGGMAGRDMEAMAIGIEESLSQDHMRARVQQVAYLGHELARRGIPVLEPFGGHAIYIDARRFYPHIPQEQFPAQRLTAEIYREGGIRAAERGILSAGRDPETGENRRPRLELVRLTIPRRTYTRTHFDYMVEAVVRAYERREAVTGLRLTYEPKHLRFFQARLAPADASAEGRA